MLNPKAKATDYRPYRKPAQQIETDCRSLAVAAAALTARFLLAVHLCNPA